MDFFPQHPAPETAPSSFSFFIVILPSLGLTLSFLGLALGKKFFLILVAILMKASLIFSPLLALQRKYYRPMSSAVYLISSSETALSSARSALLAIRSLQTFSPAWVFIYLSQFLTFSNVPSSVRSKTTMTPMAFL